MYKVGDKVRVICELEEGNHYGTKEAVISDMLKYKGQEAKITEVCEGGVYYISCDLGEWLWPEKTLVPLKMKISDKIRRMDDEEMAKYLCEKFFHGVGEDLILNWLQYNAE